jgi:hypothetical protein
LTLTPPYDILNLSNERRIYTMWIVYNKEDSWECGYSVNSRAEAEAECDKNEDLTYRYVSHFWEV